MGRGQQLSLLFCACLFLLFAFLPLVYRPLFSDGRKSPKRIPKRSITRCLACAGGGGGERGLPGVGAARAASRCPARPMMSAAASPLGPASGLSASLGPTECHPVARGAAEDSRDPRDISDAGKDASSCVIFLPIFPSVCLPRVSMAARRCRNRRWRDE